jgi:hypothetical protein
MKSAVLPILNTPKQYRLSAQPVIQHLALVFQQFDRSARVAIGNRTELLGEDMNETVVSFLNAEQAAQFLGGLNARTVTRWAREGYLPAYPIGEGKRRLWRYLQVDLTAWMLGRRQGGSCPS